MIVIGIDPGKAGAIAVTDKGILRLCTDKPSSAEAAYSLLMKYRRADVCFIERPFAVPGRSHGLKQQFEEYGMLKAVLELHQIKYIELQPSQWKRKAGLIKKDKKAAVDLAVERQPAWKWVFDQRHDLAEAYLIAAIGEEHFLP